MNLSEIEVINRLHMQCYSYEVITLKIFHKKNTQTLFFR